MTIKRIKQFFIVLLVVIINATGSSAYNIPEKFQYELTWAGLTIGSSMLETRHNGPAVQYVSRVNSSALISHFFEVNNTAVTTLKSEKTKGAKGPQLIPYHYSIEVNEGPTRYSKEIRTDYKTKKVTYIDKINRENITLALKSLALDPLSGLYYIRTLPLKTGKTYSVSVFNNKKFQTINIEVLRNDMLETPLGTVRTILIRPVMNLTGEGIFFAPGELYIWLTDDEKRIPVLIKKVIPGLSVENGQIEFFKKMPGFIKRQLKGNIDTVTARLIKTGA